MSNRRSNLIIALLILVLPIGAFAKTYFTKNLYFGLRKDAEVMKLQNFLRAQRYFSSSATGNYLQRTISAVKKFQQAHGIAPIGGYFGPESRRAADAVIARQAARKAVPPPAPAPVPVSPPGSSPPPSPPPAPAPTPALPPTGSPYQGKIGIEFVVGTSEVPEHEYMVLRNRTADQDIAVTGFEVLNGRNESFRIPTAFALPGVSGVEDPIILKPGDQVVITIGVQDRHMNFRENLCTGYFDETSAFTPSLTHQCPHPDTRRLGDFSDRCVQILDSTPWCRTVANVDGLSSACAQYAAEHFNYTGCVADYRSRKDFYSGRWLVWMQRKNEFFRNRFEDIALKDANGLTVGQYSY